MLFLPRDSIGKSAERIPAMPSRTAHTYMGTELAVEVNAQ
jgi:hypothetical protein